MLVGLLAGSAIAPPLTIMLDPAKPDRTFEGICGGNCVALRAHNNHDSRIIIKTCFTRELQTPKFKTVGSLSHQLLHVWRTDAWHHFQIQC